MSSDRLTAIEIIEDTARHYGENVYRRALRHIDPDEEDFDEFGSTQCQYLTDDGRKCGVGRWLKNPELTAIGCVESVWDIKNINDDLVERVQGQCHKFWSDIQDLHDDDVYWNHEGLTQIGREYVSTLKAVYA